MRNRLLLLVVILALGLSGSVTQAQNDSVSIRILNTADEHGWLLPFTPFGSDEVLGGAANLYAAWTAADGYDAERTLILSSGDNWTGPSISTWFQGEPVVQAFNQMDYAATAIGNHEFDFGREVLAQRIAESDYPYLAANIRDAASGDLADFAGAYALFDVDGVQVGVIGLATTDTVTTTHPANIGDLHFDPYLPTLQAVVPEVREAGADVVIVLAHVCVDELAALAPQLAGQVDAMFGGHCNAFTARTVDGVAVLEGGWAWRSYAQLDITFDRSTGTVTALEPTVFEVGYREADGPAVEPDADLEALVADWQARVDDALAEEIGYTANGIERRGTVMTNLVTDAWLWSYPTAQIAVTNMGGFRQGIDPGPITLADIVAVLPFENRLIEVTVSGQELADNLACCGGAVGGITYTRTGRGVTITWTDGSPFDLEAMYQVLVNDFMYYGGDDYLFGQQDPDGYDTGIQWRQPVIDWLQQAGTSEDAPLEGLVPHTVRSR